MPEDQKKKPYQYITAFPVRSHQGVEVLPAGVLLDGACLSDLRRNPLDRKTSHSVFFDLVKDDLGAILEKTTYDTIFRKKESRDQVFSQLRSIPFPNCGIEVAEYLKENDHYTYEHLLTVFALTVFLGSLLIPKRHSNAANIASLSHDIGKCSIPLGLLQKEAPLTAEERLLMEHHTLAGYALFHYYTESGIDPIAAEVVRDHHEYKDGSGYPAGLRSLNVLTEIVIVSDIYDALLSPRSYRKEAFDNRTALEELTMKALNGQISTSVVQALVSSNRRDEAHWSDCVISLQKRGMPPKENNYGKRAVKEE